MTLEVDAVYVNGVLKLAQPLPLPEQQRVRVTVQIKPSRVRQAYGLLGWKGDAEVVRQAALSPELGIEESP
jgi:predicted DNA-binding antitoxin AbrB/MazE fold protein